MYNTLTITYIFLRDVPVIRCEVNFIHCCSLPNNYCGQLKQNVGTRRLIEMFWPVKRKENNHKSNHVKIAVVSVSSCERRKENKEINKKQNFYINCTGIIMINLNVPRTMYYPYINKRELRIHCL